AHLDKLHQVIGGLLDVDKGPLGVPEDEELAVETDVDARRLDELGVVGDDAQATAFDGFADRAIRQDHRWARDAAMSDFLLLLLLLARSIRRRTSSSKDETSANARYTLAKRI